MSEPKQIGWTSLWTYSGDQRLRAIGQDMREGCFIGPGSVMSFGPRGTPVISPFTGETLGAVSTGGYF